MEKKNIQSPFAKKIQISSEKYLTLFLSPNRRKILIFQREEFSLVNPTISWRESVEELAEQNIVLVCYVIQCNAVQK